MENNFEMTNNEMNSPETMSRPQSLTVLCVLSFIGNGFGIITGLIGILGANAMFEFMQNMVSDSNLYELSAKQTEELEYAVEMIAKFGSSIFVILFSIYLAYCLISFFGVLKMWNLKVAGFWIYAIPNGIMSLLYFMSGNWLFAIIGVVFIVLFANHRKFMR